MKTAMMLAIAIGYASAITCGYLGSKHLIAWVLRQPSKVSPRYDLVWPLGFSGAAIAAVPGWVLATVGGGTLGGGYGEWASSSVGLGVAGVPVGLAFGICCVFTFVTCLGAVCGAFIGRLLNHALPSRLAS